MINRLETALNDDDPHGKDKLLIAKCEAIINATQAEIAHIHAQRRQDLHKVSTGFLSGQIAFHEHALTQLRAAQNHFASPDYEESALQGPRLPSVLEKAALAPPKILSALPKPSSFGLPPVFTSSIANSYGVFGGMFAGAAGLLGWRSASSAIQAQQAESHQTKDRNVGLVVSSPTLGASRFVQFLDWTTNSRGEDRKHQ